MTSLRKQPIEGRSCDGCTLCCKLMGVEALKKPGMKWCEHCKPESGCTIYNDRPRECADFYCEYRLRGELDENWYPARAKMLVVFREAINSIAIYTDADEPENWRKEPFYAQINAWAEAIYPNRGQVIVWRGRDATAIMPGREKFLGPVTPTQKIVILSKKTAIKTIYDAILAD
jgi:hypothetical protein